MGKHIIDKPKEHDDSARVRAYTKIERETGDAAQDPKVKAMHRQPHNRDSDRRVDEYLQIDRGKSS